MTELTPPEQQDERIDPELLEALREDYQTARGHHEKAARAEEMAKAHAEAAIAHKAAGDAAVERVLKMVYRKYNLSAKDSIDLSTGEIKRAD